MHSSAEQYVPQCKGEQPSVRSTFFVWGALCLFVLAFFGLVFAAPLLLVYGHGAAAGVIYKAFGYLCHQIPDRSFHLAGHQLGVCARCTGLYAGFAGGVLCFPLVRRLNRAYAPPRRRWLLLACVPITVDFALGFFGIWENTHLSRFMTGAVLGAVCALFIVPGVLDLGQLILRPARRRSLESVEPQLTIGADPSKAHGALSDYSAPYRRI